MSKYGELAVWRQRARGMDWHPGAREGAAKTVFFTERPAAGPRELSRRTMSAESEDSRHTTIKMDVVRRFGQGDIQPSTASWPHAFSAR